MKTSLPSITRIAFIECASLSPDILLRHKADIPVGVYVATRTIQFFGTPSCDTSMEHENNGNVEHTTLSFSTLDELPTDVPLAFVVTTASGKNFLIGVQEWPFPIVKIKSTTGKQNGEAATYKVMVTFSAEKSIIECAV